MKKILVFLLFVIIAVVAVIFIISTLGGSEEGAFAVLCLAPIVGGLFLAVGIISLFKKTEDNIPPPMATPKKK